MDLRYASPPGRNRLAHQRQRQVRLASAESGELRGLVGVLHGILGIAHSQVGQPRFMLEPKSLGRASARFDSSQGIPQPPEHLVANTQVVVVLGLIGIDRTSASYCWPAGVVA